jgi:tetrathionate reductase subunit B
MRRNEEPMTGLSRRGLLLGGAAHSFALAPGLTLIAQARPAGAPASAAHRWGLLIDTAKCTADCTACVAACRTEMGLQGHGRPATDAQYIRKVSVRHPSGGAERFVPVMCQHCAKPPCVDVCPTGASMKRADGVVLVDRHICIGCRYCMMACPYKARSFAHEAQSGQRPHNPRGKGTVEGCTLCVHRLDVDRPPACVEACQGQGKGAMLFGDLNDPKSDIARALAAHPATRLRADLGLDPGIAYRGI